MKFERPIEVGDVVDGEYLSGMSDALARYTNPPFAVFSAPNTTVANETFYQVPSVTIDTRDVYTKDSDWLVNGHTLRIPRTGLWAVTLNCAWSGFGAGINRVLITLDNVTLPDRLAGFGSSNRIWWADHQANQGLDAVAGGMRVLAFSEGTTFRPSFYQASGSSRTIAPRTFAQLVWLGELT